MAAPAYAPPAYTKLAGPIAGVARETGYGRGQWREKQWAAQQAAIRAELKQSQQRIDLSREALQEQRSWGHQVGWQFESVSTTATQLCHLSW